ncbi:MAG TPA: ATPase [Novosphingobium sp.]|nr:ATPase [Novosphingobium sp.]
MSQIALPLGTGPGASPRRIVVGNANAGAIEALQRPQDWPFRTAVLTGPPRAGKSLIAHWFADAGLGEAIDDARLLDETDLFHRWNRAQESATPLLLIGGAGEWPVALPDLASRLGAALHLDIGVPDDAMLADLILAHAEARGLALGPDAAAYLVPRCERSHLAVERLVATIDRLSLERKAPPGLAIWRAALDELNGESQPRLL